MIIIVFTDLLNIAAESRGLCVSQFVHTSSLPLDSVKGDIWSAPCFQLLPRAPAALKTHI